MGVDNKIKERMFILDDSVTSEIKERIDNVHVISVYVNDDETAVQSRVTICKPDGEIVHDTEINPEAYILKSRTYCFFDKFHNLLKRYEEGVDYGQSKKM